MPPLSRSLHPQPDQNLEKPDEEEIDKTARETAAALALRVDKKQAAVNPKTLPQQPGAAQYIKVGGPAKLGLVPKSLPCRCCAAAQQRPAAAARRAARSSGPLAPVQPTLLPLWPWHLQYTPADGGPQHASGAGSRIVKVQDMPVDPLEPPKFRHIKVGASVGLLSRVCCCV